MYLKALEIQGFKSFPDKTVLTFGEAITAVVGPNGSGKSNIADAIRWVMGEQSAKSLRGGKMEDVIFSGTLERKAVGYAEVSLVLDNSQKTFALEEQEVMVTRRYYRSGESEYYINRRSCRLRDIHELFMDTGLGKEGYSIIGQGKIEEILSTRGPERRNLFEEAAGISRYRHRKEEAERKLERTEENLLRIEDKISELELQVEPLRAQAEQAKQYLIYQDELREWEISVWLEQLERLRISNRKLLSDYERAVQQRSEAEQAQAQLYAQAEQLAEEMHRQDAQTEALRRQGAELEAELQQQESSAAVLDSQVRSNAENARRLELELSQQQVRVDSVAEQAAGLRGRLQEIEQKREQLFQQSAVNQEQTARMERDAEALSQALERLEQREFAFGEGFAQAKVHLSALTASAQEGLDRDTALKTQLQEMERRIQEMEGEMTGLQEQLAAALEQAAEMQNAQEGHRLRLEARQAQERQAEEQVQQLALDANGLDSRIHLLFDMEKMYEGYSKAVKLIMKAAGRTLHGIHGPVAGLLRTPDPYAVAIEIALGGAKQYLVVEKESDGKQAIEYLKQREGGRATFLPLTNIRPNRLREQGVEHCAGFVGVASELITFEERYRPVFARLLGNVVIAKELDSAIAMARKYQYRFKIVTLDGQVLNPGGSMTGGSHSRSAGILTRAGELERLRTQRAAVAAQQKSAQNRLEQAAQERQKAVTELEQAQKRTRAMDECVLKKKESCARQDMLRKSLAEQQKAVRAELATLTQRGDRTEMEICQVQAQMTQLQAQGAELHAQRTAKIAEQQAVKRDQDALRQELAQLNAAKAALEAERSATELALKQLQEMETMLSGDRENWKNQQEQCRLEAQRLSEAVNDAQSRLETLRRRRETQREEIGSLTAARLELERRRSQADRAAREKNQELLNMERECSTLEQKKAAAAMEEKRLLEQLWERYNLTFDGAQPLRRELESMAKATRRISELKRNIRSLGNVNVGAVEEFQRVNERYEYLTSQRDDVRCAKADLAEIIQGITQEMQKIFAQQFQRIGEAFTGTFLELFGGGQASLELTDPADILSCDIEIKVQPPGKTLKVLSLLSGGEKALVAIALYFAFLKVRPTPFVVMDEIEAALDERNVVRFARYLRNVSDKTQFIVITHRRGTMEEADILYGVTMQERGISKMLTLNLNEVEKTLHLKAT